MEDLKKEKNDDLRRRGGEERFFYLETKFCVIIYTHWIEFLFKKQPIIIMHAVENKIQQTRWIFLINTNT